MLVLKACPRCHGDLAVDCDRRAAFLYCVQCGHTLTLAQERKLGLRATRHGMVRTGVPADHPSKPRGLLSAAR